MGPLYLCFNMSHQRDQINFLVQQYPHCAYTLQYDFFYYREMIFIQLFCDNSLSYTRIMFLLPSSVVLVSVSILTFLYKFMVV